MKTIFLTINDLDSLIEKSRKCRHAFILKAEISAFGKQHKPKEIYLGAGAVLTLEVEVSK